MYECLTRMPSCNYHMILRILPLSIQSSYHCHISSGCEILDLLSLVLQSLCTCTQVLAHAVPGQGAESCDRRQYQSVHACRF